MFWYHVLALYLLYYIYGYPFDIYGNTYSLPDVNFQAYNYAYDVLDFNDVKDEDDENIIESLHKDY